MKEFWIYTGLRMLMFIGSLALVVTVWSLFTDSVQLIPVLIVAALVSAVGSWRFLRVPRERLAARVRERAEKAATRFEEIKAKEDLD